MVDGVDPTLFQGFAPALSPGQAGTGGFVAPLVDDPNTATNQQGSGGIDAATLAKALGQVKGDISPQQAAVANLPPGASAASGVASSGAYQGNPAGMNAFLQALMQRVATLRAASNPATARPVNMASGGVKGAGLLGL